MNRAFLPLLVVALLAATACSNSNSPENPNQGTNGDCLFAESLETLPIGGSAIAVEQPNSPGRNVIFFQAVLTDDAGNPGDLPDVVSVALWEGFGTFRNGFSTGSFDLGTETEALNCGLCVSVFADVQGNGQATQSYFANGGQVTITELDPTPGSGNLVASISNLTLTNIAVDDSGSQTVGDDACNSTVSSVSLELAIADGADVTPPSQDQQQQPQQ